MSTDEMKSVIKYFKSTCELQIKTRVSETVILYSFYKHLLNSRGCETSKTLMETLPREHICNTINSITLKQKDKYIIELKDHLKTWIDDNENKNVKYYNELIYSDKLDSELKIIVDKYYNTNDNFCYSDGFADEHQDYIFKQLLTKDKNINNNKIMKCIMNKCDDGDMKHYKVDFEYFPDKICECILKTYPGDFYIKSSNIEYALYKLFTLILNHCDDCKYNMIAYLNEMEIEMSEYYKIDVFTIDFIMNYFAHPFITEINMIII